MSLRAREPYLTDSLHPPRRPVTTAVLRPAINDTQRRLVQTLESTLTGGLIWVRLKIRLLVEQPSQLNFPMHIGDEIMFHGDINHILLATSTLAGSEMIHFSTPITGHSPNNLAIVDIIRLIVILSLDAT